MTEYTCSFERCEGGPCREPQFHAYMEQQCRAEEWVETLQLSTRARNVLLGNAVTGFEELKKLLEQKPSGWSTSAVKNMGKVTRLELEQLLIQQGFDSEGVEKARARLEKAVARSRAAQRGEQRALQEYKDALAAQRRARRSKK